MICLAINPRAKEIKKAQIPYFSSDSLVRVWLGFFQLRIKYSTRVILQAVIQSSQELREKLQVTSVSFGWNPEFLLHMNIKTVRFFKSTEHQPDYSWEFYTDYRDQH